MGATINLGSVGPGKLRLPPRSTDQRTSLSGPAVPPTMDLRTVGPGKLRLPPRDYGPAVQAFTAATLGLVPLPGPGFSPQAVLQFRSPPRSTAIGGTAAPISGLVVSHSVLYGVLFPAPAQVGFIPTLGPGAGPFSDIQFQPNISSTTFPSATGLTLSGQIVSVSVAYADLAGSSGPTGGLAVTHSVVYGAGSGTPLGISPGLSISASLAYGAMTGSGQVLGLAVSNSLAVILGVSADFQPFIPMTATTDVRLRIGYEPWKVGKSGTIG